jgi:hypothetical protein
MLDVRCLLEANECERHSNDFQVKPNDLFGVVVSRENVTQLDLASRRRRRNTLADRDVVPKVVARNVYRPRIIVHQRRQKYIGHN